MKQLMHRIARLIPVAVTGALVYLAAPQDWQVQSGSVSWSILFLAGLVSVVSNSLWGAVRWYALARANPGNLHPDFREVFRNWVGMYPLTFFVPFQLGTAGYALVFQRMNDHSWQKALALVGFEKLFSLLVLLAFCAPAIALHFQSAELWIAWSCGCSAIVVVASFLFRSNGIRLPLGHSVMFVGATLLCQATDIVSMVICAHALGVKTILQGVLPAAPVITLASMIPLAHEGIGIRELASVQILGDQIGHSAAYLLALCTSSIEYVLPALVGSVYVQHIWKTVRK